ncbi:MAG: DUF5103 domain-containing protein [Prolixibacteraceae bacterium]|jgi:hypothetical protein|nr:DUF5103 domain-containing protein [Prolixibacteraceae bacterium]MDI9564416.1 DUF5103 domain-containing protein [Bacteroidota bacterium]NLT00732.1 DUF5103 domain-containing protein [Bacteroidales bacterium]OQB79146.1 MAG: hypothetical protein BWX87_02310 [Bacteroidetes bacterium ADurb.Bin123]HNZ69622.1 DUF5103 domain-containing protein [Prolixibacteraceae bacterium]
MFLRLVVFICLGLVPAVTAGQLNRFYHENAVFREEIKSVVMHREGFELSDPILELNEDARLVLKFDDLSGEVKRYFYTILHCDAGWNESFLMQNDYLEGFPDNPVDDYARSFNTTFSYVNYYLEIPNERVQFKISGNYILLVYEDNDKEKLVLSKRFYVTEPLVRIEGTVRRATRDAFRGENQEVDFTVFHDRLRIENPREEVKIVIMQNNRWDNAVRDLKPLFIQPGRLVYDYAQENVFPAGNEFRYFDIRDHKANGEGVASTTFHRPFYHVTLHPSDIRSNKRYFRYREMNGRYVIESQERVNDYDLECDYQFVHFSLPLEAPLMGGTINVFGGLSNWNANKSNEMTWNFETSRYELTLLLKQGYYNFIYVYVPEGSATADHINLEGSFWETENNYQIFVYYKEMSGRYDRLIGYTQLNSANL